MEHIRGLIQRKTITSIKDIHGDIRNADPKKTLLVFDIDNTLLRMKSFVGTDEWVAWQLDMLRTDPNNKFIVARNEFHLYDMWEQWLTHGTYETEVLENHTKVLLEEYIETGYKIILLTARGKQLSKITIECLKEHFDIGNLFRSDLMFSNNRHLYTNGIYFTTGDDKGKCLGALLQFLEFQARFVPEKIFFIDDNERNVDHVECYFKENPISAKVYLYLYRFCQKFHDEFHTRDKDELHRRWMNFTERLI
jgi:FMN phosphatase YigB (HAD superfamily)